MNPDELRERFDRASRPARPLVAPTTLLRRRAQRRVRVRRTAGGVVIAVVAAIAITSSGSLPALPRTEDTTALPPAQSPEPDPPSAQDDASFPQVLDGLHLRWQELRPVGDTDFIPAYDDTRSTGTLGVSVICIAKNSAAVRVVAVNSTGIATELPCSSRPSALITNGTSYVPRIKILDNYTASFAAHGAQGISDPTAQLAVAIYTRH